VDGERLITLDEVAERMRVSVPTVRRWIKAGKLPATKPGGVYRVRGSAFEEFVEKNTGKAQAPPSSAETPEERRTLAERRLLSALHPFAVQVEARTELWRRLVESGRVSLDTLDYATEELGITARGFSALVDAAVAEGWSGAELGLLRRVYESIAGPYREAWNALLEAWAKSASDTQGSRRLRLVADADEAMRVVEEAEEAVSAA
jgi:excisionase family DNA binding protein